MPLSRRRFLAGSCGSIIGGGIVASELPTVVANVAQPAAGKFVDVHVHLGQPWNERRELRAATLIRWMDGQNVEQAWVLPLISPEAWFYPITTEWVLKETEPFRDRLIPFCAVDPRTAVFDVKNQFTDILKRYQDAGAKGFGEHKWGGPIDDPRNIDLIAACAEVGFPVLLHLDNDRNTDAPGLPGLTKLLETVPEATLIGHGPGWWSSISRVVTQADLGTYPKGPVAHDGTLDRLLKKYPNLYADLSAGSGHNAIRRDLEFGREFLIRHAKQILFGTDYLAEDQVIEQFGLLESIKLPADVQENIFRENALRLIPKPS